MKCLMVTLGEGLVPPKSTDWGPTGSAGTRPFIVQGLGCRLACVACCLSLCRAVLLCTPLHVQEKALLHYALVLIPSLCLSSMPVYYFSNHTISLRIRVPPSTIHPYCPVAPVRRHRRPPACPPPSYTRTSRPRSPATALPCQRTQARRLYSAAGHSSTAVHPRT